MLVGVMTVTLHMQGIGSLKEKRHIVKSVIGRLQSRFNVSISEVEHQDNKIVAVLKYPPLRMTLRNHGNFEVRKLRWRDAARSCLRIYQETLVPV